jgi:hypothetical protein
MVLKKYYALYFWVCYSAFNASKPKSKANVVASEIRCIKCDIYGRLPVTVKYITSLHKQ